MNVSKSKQHKEKVHNFVDQNSVNHSICICLGLRRCILNPSPTNEGKFTLVVRNLNHEDQTFIEIYALAVVQNLKKKKRES